jgi:hypothetical protein
MLRWLAIFVLVLAQNHSPSVSPKGATGSDPQSISKSSQQNPAKQQDATTAPITTISQIAPVQARTESHSEQPNSDKKAPDWTLSDKIAFIAAGAGFLQFLALVITIWTMHHFGRRQLRAYVVVERGIIGNIANPLISEGVTPETVARITNPQSTPVVQITIKNTGQTPAFETVHWGRICVDNFPLTSNFPPMTDPGKRFWSFIGPGIAEVKTLKLQKILTEEETQRLHAGTLAIYCHGEIRYRDAFGKKHFTQYRVMYCAAAGAWIGVGTDLTVCEEGNRAN